MAFEKPGRYNCIWLFKSPLAPETILYSPTVVSVWSENGGLIPCSLTLQEEQQQLLLLKWRGLTRDILQDIVLVPMSWDHLLLAAKAAFVVHIVSSTSSAQASICSSSRVQQVLQYQTEGQACLSMRNIEKLSFITMNECQFSEDLTQTVTGHWQWTEGKNLSPGWRERRGRRRRLQLFFCFCFFILHLFISGQETEGDLREYLFICTNLTWLFHMYCEDEKLSQYIYSPSLFQERYNKIQCLLLGRLDYLITVVSSALKCVFVTYLSALLFRDEVLCKEIYLYPNLLNVCLHKQCESSNILALHLACLLFTFLAPHLDYLSSYLIQSGFRYAGGLYA